MSGGRKATLLTGDWHFGDVHHLPRCWRQTHERALTDVIAPFKPDKIAVVMNGDVAAGKGIFRKQSDRLLFQNPSHQILLAAWEWTHLNKIARDVAPEVETDVIWGNHDDAFLVNLADHFATYLALMGVPVRFHPDDLIGNFGLAERDDAWFQAAHGFGGSQYYAQSYSQIRDMRALALEIASTRGIIVRRFLRAHTHFFQAGLYLAFNMWADTNGGWHVQTRWNLGKAVRNTGLIVYLDDGQTTEVVEVHCETGLLMEESKDPDLEHKNTEAAHTAVREAKAYVEAVREAEARQNEGTWLRWIAENLGGGQK